MPRSPYYHETDEAGITALAERTSDGQPAATDEAITSLLQQGAVIDPVAALAFHRAFGARAAKLRERAAQDDLHLEPGIATYRRALLGARTLEAALADDTRSIFYVSDGFLAVGAGSSFLATRTPLVVPVVPNTARFTATTISGFEAGVCFRGDRDVAGILPCRTELFARDREVALYSDADQLPYTLRNPSYNLGAQAVLSSVIGNVFVEGEALAETVRDAIRVIKTEPKPVPVPESLKQIPSSDSEQGGESLLS